MSNILFVREKIGQMIIAAKDTCICDYIEM